MHAFREWYLLQLPQKEGLRETDNEGQSKQY